MCSVFHTFVRKEEISVVMKLDKKQIIGYLLSAAAGSVLTLAAVWAAGAAGDGGLWSRDFPDAAAEGGQAVVENSFSDVGADGETGPGRILAQEPDTVLKMYGIPMENYDMEEGTVRSGESFSSLMNRLGVGQKQAYDLSERSRGVFDLRQMRVGNEYHVFYPKDEEHVPDYLVYDKDGRSYVLFTLKDTLAVEVVQREIVTKMDYAEVTIGTSLWTDVQKSGAPILLALKLADIYAWTIDFFALQKGDSFRAVYQTMYCEGRLLSVEIVPYAVFVHQGREYEVYYYQTENDSNTYWNERGESMRKAFLKAPLSFTRVSSRFGTRVHPITRKVQQHNGVDYAAPKGTPVMAIGDGTVEFAGRKGNEGNMVKIRHNSVYQSAYLHLSKFGKGIRSGCRVAQGQVIGYVGSTGRSTGNHLDFRIWKNGSPVNPLKVSSPPAVPIGETGMPAFRQAMAEAVALRDRFVAEDAVMALLKNICTVE